MSRKDNRDDILDDEELEDDNDELDDDGPRGRSASDEGGRRGRFDRSDRSDRSDRPRRRRGRRRKEDYFDANKTEPNYKDVDTLRRFVTERGKIRPRRQTGLTSKNQRKLAREVKRARHLALLPFTDEHMRG